VTANQPHSITIELDARASWSSAMVNHVLQHIAFTPTCLTPHVGLRVIALELVLVPAPAANAVSPSMGGMVPPRLGRKAVSTVAANMAATKAVSTHVVHTESRVYVAPPLITIRPHTHTVKYLNGSGWKTLPPVHHCDRLLREQCLEGTSSDVLTAIAEDDEAAATEGGSGVRNDLREQPVKTMTVRMAQGWRPGDHVWMHGRHVKVVPDAGAEIFMEGLTANNATARVCRTATVYSVAGLREATDEAAAARPLPRRASTVGGHRRRSHHEEYGEEHVIGHISYEAGGTPVNPAAPPEKGKKVPVRPCCMTLTLSRHIAAASAEMEMLLNDLVVRCEPIANLAEGAVSARGLQVTIETSRGLTSHVCFSLFVSDIDDPTEVIVPEPVVRFRHGLQAVQRPAWQTHGTFPVGELTGADTLVAQPTVMPSSPKQRASPLGLITCCIVAPLASACINDSDTEFFDGGYMTAVVTGGACRGDTLRLLTTEEQRLQYKQKGLSDKGASLLLYDEGTGVLRSHEGAVTATVSFPGGTLCKGLRLDFAANDGAHAQKTRVPLKLATYMLNCIAFDCNVEHVKPGRRTVTVSITDKVGVKPGAAEIFVVVASPLVYAPHAAADMSVAAGAVPANLAQKVQVFFGRDDSWGENGGISIDVTNPDADPDYTAIGDGLLFDPAAFPQTPFKLAADTEAGAALTDAGGAFMGYLTVSQLSISLRMTRDSVMTQRQFEAFLRCVTFEARTYNKRSTTRTVQIWAHDGATGPTASATLCSRVLLTVRILPSRR
jgi:hypothetical protein